MTLQYSVAVRNAKLDAVETQVGATAKLKVFSGAQPANCAAADPSGTLVSMTLPADWLAAAGSGTKAISGVWSATASGSGTAASWRIYANDGTTCGMQGNTTDMVFDNTNIASGQTVTVTAFTLTAGNS